MRKLYLINILLIVILFYAGIHLNEEEQAFLAGLREGKDSYDWASTAYSIFAILACLFSTYVAIQTLEKMKWGGGLLLFMSVVGALYAIWTLLNSGISTMQDVLLIFGPYVVLGMWLNVYIFLKGDFHSNLSTSSG